MVKEVLDPCIVGVAGRWWQLFPKDTPPGIVPQQVATPVAVVEGRIGNYVIGFQVLVCIVEKAAFIVPLHIAAVDSTDGQVHLCQPPGGLVALLAVNGDIVGRVEGVVRLEAAFTFIMILMMKDEFLTLHKHATAATARVEYSAFVRLKHFNQKFYDAGRCIELPAFFSFCHGKLSKEVFVHPTQNVFALCFLCSQGGGANQVDQSAQTGFIQLFLGKYLWQYATQGGIVLFNGIHGVIHILADGG